MSSIKGLFDVPLPHPEVTLILPGNAGKVRVCATQVWATDDLLSHLIVEMPTWEKWTENLDGMEVHGVKPSTLSMWVPLSSIRVEAGEMKRIWSVIMEALEVEASA
ncbi:hypothetical protein OG698_45980 [Streptomyces sp. NBC_01003]|uniref:hypothetical protein n=1 Tax=Streptomyces sp. NBC_01003 TaxID=2903714 RepID=UPI003867EC90|nr:hypothetical protein OG698_45980 [Streptomyces sp. NBC_01003]